MRRYLPFAVALLFLAAAPCLAQTPDEETPAEESVCDVLIGGTPGLYGLCVAYCEAQDAELEVGMFSGAVCTDRTSHDRLLTNYRNKMRPGDPDMPCLRDPCPCFNSADLDAISLQDDACTDEEDRLILAGLNDDSLRCKASASVSDRKGQLTCAYRVDVFDAGIPKCIGETGVTAMLTPEEYAACVAVLEAEISARGLVCSGGGGGGSEEP